MLKSEAVLHPWRVRIGFLILVVAVMFAFIEEGRKDNATRCAIVALVKNLSENSRRNSVAAQASPTATDAQKRAAAENVKVINATLQTTADVLGHPSGRACSVP